MPRPTATLSGILLLVFGAGLAPAQEKSWPQFLGPNRNGVSSEKGLMTAWPKAGPPEVWRVPGGAGMSGIAVRDGRAITMVQSGESQKVIALDAGTGKPLWAANANTAFSNPMGNGPRGTPTVTADGVYAFTGDGVLVALKPDSGEPLWKQDVVGSLEGQIADYGMSCSPLVTDTLVIVTPGAPGAAVAAYDRKSGKLAWKTGDHPSGYSSPALLKVGGREQVVAFLGDAAVGLEPASGKVLWQYPYTTDFNCNIATPLSVEGNVFLSAGENHGSVLLSLKDPASPEEIWSSHGPDSVLRNEWQTSILLDGYLYGFDNVGGAGPVTHLTCVEAKTGKRAWQKIRFGKGNMIAADGKLFIATMKGELIVAKANPKAYEELGRKVYLESTRQAPSLAGGKLYLRDSRDIVCLDVK